MKKQRIFAFLAVIGLLSGCTTQPAATTAPGTEPTGSTLQTGVVENTQGAWITDTSDFFSDRDLRGDYDPSSAAVIQLSGSSAECRSDAVTVEGGTVTVRDEGTYILTGTLEDGMVIVDADKEDKVQLVLRDASVSSSTGAALYILRADKVFLTLAEGTENRLANGGSFAAIDDNNIDAALFSKEDLTLNGGGKLTVDSPAGHGIVSKDELTVTGGDYEISSASHGMTGKDSVCIAGGTFVLTSGKDGIHAENDEDGELGYLYIGSGTFDITSEGDGISAGSWMQLDGGSYTLFCGGGSANGTKQTSDGWGMGPGGMGGRPGGMGGWGGMPPGGNGSTDTSAEDSASSKGFKAAALVINGGSYTVDTADDAFHANGALTVNTGVFQIATGDDGFHADEALTFRDGTVTVTESYEGLEGLSVQIDGGQFQLKASDDGINAAGGADRSGFGGFRGNDKFGGGGNPDSFIRITGGELYLNASGDGIDSNGTLEISGGSVTVCGPTQGDTAVLDYDTTGVITGGTFIGTGSRMMAQTFSSAGQGVIALQVGDQPAGTRITLKDRQGNVLFSYTPELPFAILIVSSPQMVKGQTYTVTVGEVSGTFEAS